MAEKRDGSVQSVERALTLLETLSEDEEGLRLTDLATRCSLSNSTTHRLLTTLQKRRFVEFDKTNGLWHVGRQAFAVGATFVGHRNYVAVAIPYLKELRDKTRETANLGIIEDGDLVTLAQVESREIMRATSRVGGRVPVFATGMGKAILATYPDDALIGYVAPSAWKRFTENTIANETEFIAALAQTRKTGYATDDEEFHLGLRCVAAPVFDAKGDAFCALSISGLSARVPPERMASIGRLVAETADRLTLTLGGTRPAMTR